MEILRIHFARARSHFGVRRLTAISSTIQRKRRQAAGYNEYMVFAPRSRPLQPPVTYAFVDAGHLKPNFANVTERWFGVPVDLDVATIRTAFQASKVFYYDSIDDVLRPDESSADLEARVREQEVALREVNAIVNTHVRYGSITGRGKRKRQKEVDILIAVDMMNHAARQNMDKAVLLTGDRDFTPLVETLVQMGLTVEVAGDYRFTSDILREAADHYRPLALHEYSEFVEHSARSKMPPFPSFAGDLAQNGVPLTPLCAGPVGNKIGTIHFLRTLNCFALELSDRYSTNCVILSRHQEFDWLKLYLELQYAEVPWFAHFTSEVPSDNALWHQFRSLTTPRS